MKKVDEDVTVAPSVFIGGATEVPLHWRRAISTVNETGSWERHQTRKNQESNHWNLKQLVNAIWETRQKTLANGKDHSCLNQSTTGPAGPGTFNTYCLAGRPWLYDDQVAKHVTKYASRLQAQMKGHTFDPMYPVPIIGLFHTFMVACDDNGIHEEATMWL